MATGTITYNALRTKTVKERIKTQRKIVSHSNSTRAMMLVQERLPLNHIFPYAQWNQFGSQGIVVKCTAAIFFLTVDCNSRAQPVFFCSLKLLFGDVPVAVAVVNFLNSLIKVEMTHNDVQLFRGICSLEHWLNSRFLQTSHILEPHKDNEHSSKSEFKFGETILV